MAFLGVIPEATESTFGSRIGGHLGDVLQSLAAHKAHKMKHVNNQEFLESIGFHPSVARPLSRQSDEQIGNFLKQLEGFNVSNQAQQYPQGNQQALERFAYQQNNYQKQPHIDQIMPQKQQEQLQPFSGMVQDNGIQNQSIISPAQIGQIQQNKIDEQALHPSLGLRSKGSVNEQDILRKELYNSQLKEREEAKKESHVFLKKLNEDVKAAKEDNIRLDRMQELNKSNKLADPVTAAIIKTIGEGVKGVGSLDLTSFLSPESQEFNKLSNDFVKSAKIYFGSRITDQDLRVFMSTVPTLTQNKEGRNAVIRNLKLANDARLLRQKTAQEIIKENNNVIPVNLEQQVDEKAERKLDNLSQRFIKGIDNTSAKSDDQNNYTLSDIINKSFKLLGRNKYLFNLNP